MEQNAGATSIEVDEGNIKSFDRVARKCETGPLGTDTSKLVISERL